jgi:hypothetical protein
MFVGQLFSNHAFLPIYENKKIKKNIEEFSLTFQVKENRQDIQDNQQDHRE